MTTPTISDLYTSIQSDLRNKLSITTIVGKMVLNAIAIVQATKLKIYYLIIAFVYKNILPDTADPENLGGSLSRFGVLKLNRLPLAATAGEYYILATGSIGATISANTTFKSLDGSTSPDKLFVLDTNVTLTGTTEQIKVRALDLGTQARLEAGDQLQVTQPLANINSFMSVVTVETTPLDEETTEEYRQKVIQAYQVEPQGGAKSDYRLWSLDAQGVRTSYPYINSPGIIDLYVEANFADSTDGHGTPSQAILDDVAEVVEFDPDTTLTLGERGRRPMGAFQINFLPVTPLTMDISISGLTDTSFLPAIKTAIEAFIFDKRPFIDGADDPNNSQKAVIFDADIYTIVRGVIGTNAYFTSISMFINTSQYSVYTLENGDIIYLDNVA